MKLKEIVKEVINEWDPINLYPSAPENEYEPEVNEIVELIKDIKEETMVALLIQKTFLKWFSKDMFHRNLDDCLIVARRIINKKNKVIPGN